MDALGSSLAGARAALPVWAGFIGLPYWSAALFLIAWTASWTVSTAGLWPLRPRADAPPLHWTVRARIGFPVRVVLGVCFVVALVFPSALRHAVTSPLARTPGWLTVLTASLAA